MRILKRRMTAAAVLALLISALSGITALAAGSDALTGTGNTGYDRIVQNIVDGRNSNDTFAEVEQKAIGLTADAYSLLRTVGVCVAMIGVVMSGIMISLGGRVREDGKKLLLGIGVGLVVIGLAAWAVTTFIGIGSSFAV